jgi:hypothetical protein
MVTEPLRWYDEKDDHTAWIKALAEVRTKATREGWCYQHVQAIIVAIDQYAETALGNRQFFLNKPHSIGGSRNEQVP